MFSLSLSHGKLIEKDFMNFKLELGCSENMFSCQIYNDISNCCSISKIKIDREYPHKKTAKSILQKWKIGICKKKKKKQRGGGRRWGGPWRGRREVLKEGRMNIKTTKNTSFLDVMQNLYNYENSLPFL